MHNEEKKEIGFLVLDPEVVNAMSVEKFDAFLENMAGTGQISGLAFSEFERSGIAEKLTLYAFYILACDKHTQESVDFALKLLQRRV